MLPWQPFLAFYIWGAHWRHLKNTTEPSMCGGDAALCQITLTTCYYYYPLSVTNLRQNRHAYIIIRIIINTRYSERESLHNSQSTKRNKQLTDYKCT